MIKKILFLSVSVLLIAACGNNDNTEKNKSDTTEIKLAEVPEINLNEFDSLAANYVGKEVKVTGIVDHVCKHGGKKLLLVDGDYNLHIFNDNRFKESLSGSKVTVKGIVEQEVVDSAYLAEKLKHEQKSYVDADDAEKEKLKDMTKYITKMQDSLKKSGLDHFTNYSLKFETLEEKK
ncbi:MAG: hypothetical protein GXO80_00245 [Chlorobi bacterium]|nr:hypothetical protein [Chlorobiota bacterium]